MQTDNPFAAPEFPTDSPPPPLSDQQIRAMRIAAPRWWLCSWLGTAAAGSIYGIVAGTAAGLAVGLFFGLWGFLFAASAGFLMSSLGLVPLLLLRSRLPHRWFPLALAMACGGTSGQLCAGWAAACLGAVGAFISVKFFGWPRLPESLE